jgi:predicted Zn finger-like uncharacterized protein
MVISCPACQARYRINPAASKSQIAKVKCPGCQHIFDVSLTGEQKSQPEQRAVSSGPVVLVVDDARFFREMIKDILKELPITVALAADGHEAWKEIFALSPQLVLLDLNIPGKSGKEIVQELRQSTGSKQVKVVAMSGVERGAAIASEMRLIGADDFINKSFTPRELQDRVRKILGL